MIEIDKLKWLKIDFENINTIEEFKKASDNFIKDEKETINL